MSLPTEFKKYGDTMTLMSLSGDYRIYRRVNPAGTSITYEIMKPVFMNGEYRLPGASFWGIYGWTCLNEKAVVTKINELNEKADT